MTSIATYAEDADLLIYVPDAASVDSTLRALVLEDTKEAIDLRWFGDKSRYAHVLLTAHRLALLTGTLGGESGPIASRSAGAISVSYAVNAASDPELASTKWGRLFLQVSQSVPHSGVGV